MKNGGRAASRRALLFFHTFSLFSLLFSFSFSSLRLCVFARDNLLEDFMTPSRPAVVLLSGGLDSATVLAIARDEGFRCHALTVDYGQRHSAELAAARRVAKALGAVEHRLVSVDLRDIGGSALTSDVAVPKDRPLESMSEGIPITYVPARNTVFLALALGWAEVLGAFDLWVGVNALDYSGYPDCRPEFVAAFENLANLATKAGVENKGRFRIHAPLIQSTKADIIRRGLALGVDYSLTHSCYDPVSDGAACGRCDACQLRKAGFEAAGVADPTRYAPQ
jgi:7-cyano-7-deazaguanine synthase